MRRSPGGRSRPRHLRRSRRRRAARMADDQRHRRLCLRHRRRPADPRLPWPAGGGARSAGRPHREAGHRHREASRSRGSPSSSAPCAGTDGTVAPSGYRYLERFWLDGRVPVWRFATGRFVLEKRVHMDQGANVTRIDYADLWSREPLALSLRVITDHRDYHGRTFAWDGAPAAGRRRRHAERSGRRDRQICMCGCESGRAEASGTLVPRLRPPPRRARAASPTARTTCSPAPFQGDAGARRHGAARRRLRGAPLRPSTAVRARRGRARERSLLRRLRTRRAAPMRRRRPNWVRHLVLAADQFVVARAPPAAGRRSSPATTGSRTGAATP